MTNPDPPVVVDSVDAVLELFKNRNESPLVAITSLVFALAYISTFICKDPESTERLRNNLHDAFEVAFDFFIKRREDPDAAAKEIATKVEFIMRGGKLC